MYHVFNSCFKSLCLIILISGSSWGQNQIIVFSVDNWSDFCCSCFGNFRFCPGCLECCVRFCVLLKSFREWWGSFVLVNKSTQLGSTWKFFLTLCTDLVPLSVQFSKSLLYWVCPSHSHLGWSRIWAVVYIIVLVLEASPILWLCSTHV